ncbi:hypothetical protein ACI2L1_14425 [Streptomyces sp. NPDC019531]|uniref:hypothetical protein n=1 Tax=Streptomyces sp. NPDC019531 TaxID=3365062 RepID=UPI00384B00BF
MSLRPRSGEILAAGDDACRLLERLHRHDAGYWPGLQAEALRQIVMQNYYRDAAGRLRWRTADDGGLPPSSSAIVSPCDTTARYVRHGHIITWKGFAAYVTETCASDSVNVITDVATTSAVRRRTGVRYRAVLPQGVLLRDDEGTERLEPADTVVISAGQTPVDALRPVLTAAGVTHRVAGGAADARDLNAVRAVEEGMRAAHALAREAADNAGVRRRAAVLPTRQPLLPGRTPGPTSSATG